MHVHRKSVTLLQTNIMLVFLVVCMHISVTLKFPLAQDLFSSSAVEFLEQKEEKQSNTSYVGTTSTCLHPQVLQSVPACGWTSWMCYWPILAIGSTASLALPQCISLLGMCWASATPFPSKQLIFRCHWLVAYSDPHVSGSEHMNWCWQGVWDKQTKEGRG